MALNKKISDNLTKRFIVINIAMKAGALVLALAAVGVLVTVLARVGDKALAPEKPPGEKETVQPAQPTYAGATRIYTSPPAGSPSPGFAQRSAPGHSQAPAAQPQPTEGEVRYIMAKMGLVGEGSYYRVIDKADPSSNEALKRWGLGIRPTNLAEFELLSTPGGAVVVRKGATAKIDGLSVMLSAPRN